MTGDAPFRVLMTCGVFEPGFRAGGPVRSIAGIVDTLSEKIDLTLVTSDRDLGATEPYPGLSGRWVPRGRAKIFYLDIRSVRQWFRLLKQLRAQRYDLLYVNSFWSPVFTAVPVLAARLGLIRARQVLVAPRGELARAALDQKKRKKRVAFRWWRFLLGGLPLTWHASSALEAGDIQAAIPGARVHTSLNQVSLPKEPLAISAAPDPILRLVFIGRISPMKNLDLVIRAAGLLRSPAKLDIYGPRTDPDYWAFCQRLMKDGRTGAEVEYRGELPPDQVRATFARYDAFVFPTRGENFGHVIAESLSASCPVICSANTPWSATLAGGGGIVVDELNAEAFAAELEKLARRPPAERDALRAEAGEAYRAWRTGSGSDNILDLVAVS
jgi:glycosyltransferase involved in cell wall biosynthesis